MLLPLKTYSYVLGLSWQTNTIYISSIRSSTPSLSLHGSSPLVAPSPLSLTPTFTTYQISKPDKTTEEHSHCFHNPLTLLRCRVPAQMNECVHNVWHVYVSLHRIRKSEGVYNRLQNILKPFTIWRCSCCCCQTDFSHIYR